MATDANATNDYYLPSDWWFEATTDTIYDILSDTDAMRRWWRAFILPES